MSSIKKAVYTIIAFIAVIGIGCGLCLQVIVPTSFKTTKVEVHDLPATDLFVTTFAKECDAGTRSETDYPVSYKGKLPSDNPTDYKIAYCYFKGVNRSFLDNFHAVGTLEDAAKYKENIMFACNSDGGSYLSLSRHNDGGSYAILVLYTGNLSEEQIRELIEGITLTVKSDGSFLGTRMQTISYIKCSDISFVPVSEE